MRSLLILTYVIAATALLAPLAAAEPPPAAAQATPNATPNAMPDTMPMHHHHGAPEADTRTLVEFPPALREHMLANMRIHVAALNDILAALAAGKDDEAAHIAEWQLGLSSLKAHRASELGKYMPKQMQEIGGAMHRAASRFAIEAQNAGVTDDLRPALAALSEMTAQCTACHASYRVH